MFLYILPQVIPNGPKVGVVPDPDDGMPVGVIVLAYTATGSVSAATGTKLVER